MKCPRPRRLRPKRATGLICAIFTMLLVSSVTPISSALLSMNLVAVVSIEQTEPGHGVIITGRVTGASGTSLPDILVSIQVNDPLGTSIHIALDYTLQDGSFRDKFTLPQGAVSGNYTIYVSADKPGYAPVSRSIVFSFLTPDFSLTVTPQSLSVRQGEAAFFTVSVFSRRTTFLSVNLTLSGQPTPSATRFDKTSIIPNTSTALSIQTTSMTPAGIYNLTVTALTGQRYGLIRSVTVKMVVLPADQLQSVLPLFTIAALGVVAGGAFMIVWSSKRKRRGETIKELLGQLSVDKGYLATARAIAKLEELRALGKVDEETYQQVKREYEKRLEKAD